MSLEEIANYIVSDGKGILAADESNPTCGKRFDSTIVEEGEALCLSAYGCCVDGYHF